MYWLFWMEVGILFSELYFLTHKVWFDKLRQCQVAEIHFKKARQTPMKKTLPLKYTFDQAEGWKHKSLGRVPQSLEAGAPWVEIELCPKGDHCQLLHGTVTPSCLKTSFSPFHFSWVEAWEAGSIFIALHACLRVDRKTFMSVFLNFTHKITMMSNILSKCV